MTILEPVFAEMRRTTDKNAARIDAIFWGIGFVFIKIITSIFLILYQIFGEKKRWLTRNDILFPELVVFSVIQRINKYDIE